MVPLFVLMGNFVHRSDLGKDLYRASYAFLGHWPGGLAMATIVACGGFSAICGSSVATAATMAKVSMPEMRRYGYADSLATGSLAAGGTLGILIPPSVLMIIYGLLTEFGHWQAFHRGHHSRDSDNRALSHRHSRDRDLQPRAGPAGRPG